jgi:hypothetical protein
VWQAQDDGSHAKVTQQYRYSMRWLPFWSPYLDYN